MERTIGILLLTTVFFLTFSRLGGAEESGSLCQLVNAYKTDQYPAVRKSICQEKYAEACILGDFYWKNDAPSFLRAIQPKGFWGRVEAIDSISYHACPDLNDPLKDPLKGKGLPLAYLDALVALIDQGQSEALKTFFKLAASADGDIAENCEDMIVHLLDQRMGLILAQWADVGSALARFSLETTALSKTQIDSWKNALTKLCTNKDGTPACQGLKKYLESLGS